MNRIFTNFDKSYPEELKPALDKSPSLEAILEQVNSLESSLSQVEEIHTLTPLLEQERKQQEKQDEQEQEEQKQEEPKPPNTEGEKEDVFEDLKYKHTDRKMVFGQPIDIAVQKRGFLGVPVTDSGSINVRGMLKDLQVAGGNRNRFLIKHFEKIFGVDDSEVTGALKPIINVAKKAGKLEKDFRHFFHF